ncbi:polysaccharide deacetylase family protein [Candidatus Woesearchaeota archaeon]|nr:polysaccharide deacetylase family protein [Candidatus Woesearchaeota archaeon]
MSLLGFNHVIWDESSYIGMGKFFYSFGRSGILETIRPMTLSLVTGFVWVIGLDVIIFSKMFVLSLSAGSVFLIYKLGEKIYSQKTGLIAAALLAITPLFIQYGTYILTGIPSTFLALLSVYFLIKKRFFWTGIFAGLSFMTRFPQALVPMSIIAAMAHEFMTKKKQRNTILGYSIIISAGLLSVLLPYFSFNYFLYRGVTSEWWHAAFRPLIFLFQSAGPEGYFWFYKQSVFFYFIELFLDNPFTVFIIAWPIGITQKRFRKEKIIVILAAAFLLMLTLQENKQFRHALMFLPYVMLLASKGITTVFSKIKRTNIKIGSVIILGLIFFASLLAGVQPFQLVKPKPAIVSEYYEFLSRYPTEGAILITDPVITAYADNLFVPAYFDLKTLRKELSRQDYDMIFFTDSSFPCREDDIECQNEKKDILSGILKQYGLVFEGNYYGYDYFIFSNLEYIPKLSKRHLLTRYGLMRPVQLSSRPFDKLPIIIILEDLPSLDENMEMIWQKENYDLLFSYFNKKRIPVTAAVIPTHIQNLNQTEVSRLIESNFSFIQNGYSHSELQQRTTDEEYERIKKGKEIILEKLGTNVTGFIPPYYSATTEKIHALEKLGFSIYVSNMGDLNVVPFSRYDQTMTLIKNWNKKELKEKEEISQEIIMIDAHEPYLMISFYYYMFENNFNVLDYFMNASSIGQYIDIYSFDEWQNSIKNVNLSVQDELIVLSGKEFTGSDMITLLFIEEGNYSLDSSYPVINIKNIGEEQLEICLENQCNKLEPGEIQKIDLIGSS